MQLVIPAGSQACGQLGDSGPLEAHVHSGLVEVGRGRLVAGSWARLLGIGAAASGSPVSWLALGLWPSWQVEGSSLVGEG